MKKPRILVPPWTLIIDNREQLPWLFENITIGTNKSVKDLRLTIKYGTLSTGDYSVIGLEHRVAIERKSPSDLFATLSRSRERFIQELSRLNDLEFAAVIVECEWSEMMTNPPIQSKLAPVSANGMIVAWQIRYPRVHWWFLPGRYVASKMCFKLLDRFYLETAE